ncbi:MAG: hypothetical protein ABIN37_09095 [Burkholderiaceae bacterium]
MTAPSMLNEANIPPELLPQTRAWFDRQMAHLERVHGDRWPDHRKWLVDYLNEDIRQRLIRREVTHVV